MRQQTAKKSDNTVYFEVLVHDHDRTQQLAMNIKDLLDRTGIENAVLARNDRITVHVESDDVDEQRYAVRIMRRAGYQVLVALDDEAG